MGDGKLRIFPLGDSALTVEFGDTISAALNEKAIALADPFEQDPFLGFIESVPAYSSTTVFYDLVEVRRNFPEFPTAFRAVESLAIKAVGKLDKGHTEAARLIKIPVSFDKEAALDLDHIAEKSSRSRENVIDIFTALTYRVFMLGFLPGFSYMGEVDARIAVPRKETPRLFVPKGSVGIAGKQTGIYSMDSPGGWQIIGRTDLELFTPNDEIPTLLRPGDRVKFFSI